MAESSGSARVHAEVNLEGGSVDDGAKKLNPILQRVAARSKSAGGTPPGGGAGLMFSRLQYSRSAGS